ncbi:hypothetical protein TNCT_511881 [Trichonephila clavata]|uniref:MATH domain-containing protein n=1 Tax=Trichonephila clavata TaxID=2740835 RepID=A0A8X6LZS0_TRICU|nr:hypothetical protein TNCT_511881 [Trichonephila clavata]
MNFEREGYTFVWKVENLSCAWQRVGKKIESPIFTLDAIEKTRWRLVLYPKGEKIGNYISLYLKRLEGSKGSKVIAIDYELSFLTRDGEILKPNFVSNDTFQKGQAKGASQFKMRDETFQSKCVDEDILTAYCRIWVSSRKNTGSARIFASTIINIDKFSFVWDIENFSKMEISQRNDYVIKSALGDHMVTLELFLTVDNSDELINIYVKTFNQNIKFFRLNSCLLDATGNRTNSGMQEFRAKDLLAGEKLILISKKKLVEKKNIYLPNDILSLNCECDFSTKIAFEGIERIEHGISSKFKKERTENILSMPSIPLVDALRSMYSEGLFCDTELLTRAF